LIDAVAADQLAKRQFEDARRELRRRALRFNILGDAAAPCRFKNWLRGRRARKVMAPGAWREPAKRYEGFTDRPAARSAPRTSWPFGAPVVLRPQAVGAKHDSSLEEAAAD